MAAMVPIALFGWIPLILILFALLPARRAVLTAFIVGWLFLPMSSFKIPGLPDYNKITATNLGVLVAALLFDSGRMMKFRPRWFDLPALVFCVSPFFSSLTNNLGAYDGISAIAFNLFLWGIPYFIGRVYFNDLTAMRELAIAIFAGAMLYVPLCLYEMRMSPQLHRQVYGFMQQTFRESKRWGGYRPAVFLQHGLAVGMFMCTAALAGWWMWRSGAVKRIKSIPMGLAAVGVLGTALLCKSTGAVVLLAAGLMVLYLAVKMRTAVPFLCLVLFTPIYIGARMSGLWSREQLMNLTGDVIGTDRADSLGMRLRNEDQLTAKALQRPMFGWGRWGRNQIVDEETGKHTVTDGMWVILIGQAGMAGLVSFTLLLLLPVGMLWYGCPARFWGQPAIAPAAAMTLLLVIHMIDNLFNAMPNPIFMLAAGGLPQVAAICAAACAAAKAPPAQAPSTRLVPQAALRRI
ncbi:MAG TPA: hypothetical protein VGQ99_20550 [Tepidisphaeraceae bacterium]|jgi:hypothetical protein|nr:hypothetical protein [Tepidisphaeraceae bacterium]